MDPRQLDPIHWERIAQAMVAFYAFVSLLLGAIAGATGGWVGRPRDIPLQAVR